MTTALIYFSASLVALVLLSSLFIIEDARGHRVLLSGARNFLDRLLLALWSTLQRFRHRVWDGFVHIILRYGVHTLLGAVLAFLRRLEQRVEHAVLRNRQAARTENRPRTHLDEIADHKEAVALSDEEKERRRND